MEISIKLFWSFFFSHRIFSHYISRSVRGLGGLWRSAFMSSLLRKEFPWEELVTGRTLRTTQPSKIVWELKRLIVYKLPVLRVWHTGFLLRDNSSLYRPWGWIDVFAKKRTDLILTGVVLGKKIKRTMHKGISERNQIHSVEETIKRFIRIRMSTCTT